MSVDSLSPGHQLEHDLPELFILGNAGSDLVQTSRALELIIATKGRARGSAGGGVQRMGWRVGGKVGFCLHCCRASCCASRCPCGLEKLLKSLRQQRLLLELGIDSSLQPCSCFSPSTEEKSKLGAPFFFFKGSINFQKLKKKKKEKLWWKRCLFC